MKKYSIKYYSLIFGLVLLGCKQTEQEKTSRVEMLPYYSDAAFTPHWLSKGDKALEEFHTIPNYSLVNQLGATVTEDTFENKIYITDFFFTTCPGICPKMTANMSILQDEFLNDDEVLLLSHSVTPETDSVEVLKDYAEAKGVLASKWHLVTGERQTIYDLGRQSYFVEEDLGEVKTDDDFLHTENFVLVDKNKHIRGIYNGLNKTAVAQLIADVKTLQKED
ncbi:SCO family protein [Winogradskyella pacifica]|uniref:SCO family protein n=1 Tax=Winogradskyella pacifica TaxID=664642 RepID=UPI0015C961C3|nr:SCO family protein [Winogradskyella pacifica]